MNAIYLVLYILAFVCFVVAAFLRPIAGPPVNAWHPLKVTLIAAGLALWVLVPLVAGFQTVSGK
jgi:uncharacterized membrane protein